MGIKNIAPKVIALLEKTQREHEFFGLPIKPYSILQTYHGASMGALGEFEEGERLFEKALSFGHKINDLNSKGVAELIYGLLFVFKGDGENCVVCGRFILKNAAHRTAAIGWVHLECWE